MRTHLISAAILALFANAALASDPTPPPASAPKAAVAPKLEKLSFTNKMIDGKKVWVPSEGKVAAGTMVEITLVNTLADPHGFTAPGFTTEPVIVGGNETKVITVQAKDKGDYKFSCQMHPAHVGGTITVQ